MVVKSLNGHEYADVSVWYDDPVNMRLVSYTTVVLEIKDNVLHCNGLYSATTRKHISWFMHEYTDYTYYDVKRAYEHNADLDLTTGLYLLSEDFFG